MVDNLLFGIFIVFPIRIVLGTNWIAGPSSIGNGKSVTSTIGFAEEVSAGGSYVRIVIFVLPRGRIKCGGSAVDCFWFRGF